MPPNGSGSTVVFNVGSSTVKFATFIGAKPSHRGSAALLSPNDDSKPIRITVRDAVNTAVYERLSDGGLAAILPALREVDPQISVAAFGHRVVHGSHRFTAPVRIDEGVLKELDTLSEFAPLHQPRILDAIRALQKSEPAVPQVACFDTAFHATMPKAETMFGLPHAHHDAGIRRYGFHGLAFESVVEQLPDFADKRIVACHLGSGSSICGISQGKSVCTTMGCTPLDGLLMGTRCGRLDPGVILHLMHHKGMTADQLSELLYHESGLLGVSGVSADMRDLLKSNEPKAADAVELYCHMAVREIGSVIACLGGLDAMVFSGGIGENSPAVRERILRSFEWLGLKIDPVANSRNASAIHDATSAHPIFVRPAREEAVIARQTASLLGLDAP